LNRAAGNAPAKAPERTRRKGNGKGKV